MTNVFKIKHKILPKGSKQIYSSTLIAIVLTFVIYSTSVYSTELSTIYWYKPDSPPGHIISGELKSQGYSDEMQRFFTKQLNEYEHVDVIASYQRAITEMAKKTGCIVGIFPDEERKKHLVFSKVRQIVFSNGLILPERHLTGVSHLLDENGAISLAEFLHQPDFSLVGGVSSDRIYGTEIDKYLKDPSTKLVHRPSENVFTGLLLMLARERVDYIFGYPVELQYALRQQNISDKFHFIPIKEMPEYLTSYIACSKTPSGIDIIEKINSNLLKYRQSDTFYLMYENWLDERSARRFEKLSNNFYGQYPNL